MGPLCDLCGIMKAVVYCKSDSARLCLECDVCVHAANALSCRHSRNLLCDKCNSEAAYVHCMNDKFSLCQDCDHNWNQNGCCSLLKHKRQVLNSYTGCPSFSEFSRFLAFVLNASNDHEWELINLLQKNETKSLEKQPNDHDGSFDVISDKLNEIEPCVDFQPWMEEEPPNPNRQNLPKENNNDEVVRTCTVDVITCFEPLNVNDLVTHDGNGLNMENIQFNFENCADEIFDCSQMATRYHNSNGGMNYDQLMENNNILASKSNALIDESSNVEASSSIKQDFVASFQSSWADDNNGNCVLTHPNNFNESINLGFSHHGGHINSSMPLSLPNITCESNATNYQDYGLPTMFLTEESSWEPNLEISCPQAREKAKIRYNEKKKTRRFGKQIRYVSRKVRADTRKRVKGRFVKASEAHGCDSQGTNNF